MTTKRLDNETLETAFRIMGEYLRDRKTLGEIVVYGGSSLMLQFSWRESTGDVDAVVRSDGNHGLVRAAADHAAQKLGLERSWLSESVAVYASVAESAGDRKTTGMYPDYNRPGLRVLTARPEYVLAMKLFALERSTSDDRDFADIVNLALEIGIDSVDAMTALAAQYFPTEGLPVDAKLRLEEVVEEIKRRKSTP